MPDTYDILKEVGKELSTDTSIMILPELKQYQGKINQLIQNIKNINRRKSRESKAAVLREGYLTIMQIREFFLGETITYRLYLQTSDMQETRVVEMTTEQILNRVGYERGGLRLRQMSDAYIRSIESHNSQYEAYVDAHLTNIRNQLKEVHSRSYTGYIANTNIRTKYNHPQNLYKKNGSPRTFNMGWIYQALDATINDLYTPSTDPPVNNGEFERVYFTKNLAYDNLIGFKGGDVDNVQIKANAASLMSSKSILRYLNDIQALINSLSSTNTEKLSNEIKRLFTDTGIDIDQTIDKHIDTTVNKLLQEIKTKI